MSPAYCQQMAGYGTTLEAPPHLDLLIRALLRAAQRRARSLGLRMKYRCHPGGDVTRWDISIRGNGYVIAAWSQWLKRDLPVVAEGFVGIGDGYQARNAAISLVARWTGWCVGDEENVTVSTNGSDRVGWFWPVLDIPEAPSLLAPRLRISDGLIARWMVGDLPEEVAIEELHTAIEGLLRSVLRVGRGPNWPRLLLSAESAGFLSATASATLGSFNALHRNRLKHQALALTGPEREVVKDLLSEVLVIGERLLRNIE